MQQIYYYHYDYDYYDYYIKERLFSMLVFINLNICVKYVYNPATCMRCRMKDDELFER